MTTRSVGPTAWCSNPPARRTRICSTDPGVDAALRSSRRDGRVRRRPAPRSARRADGVDGEFAAMAHAARATLALERHDTAARRRGTRSGRAGGQHREPAARRAADGSARERPTRRGRRQAGRGHLPGSDRRAWRAPISTSAEPSCTSAAGAMFQEMSEAAPTAHAAGDQPLPPGTRARERRRRRRRPSPSPTPISVSPTSRCR